MKRTLGKLLAWWMASRGWRPYEGITIKLDGPRVVGHIVWDVFGRQWIKEGVEE